MLLLSLVMPILLLVHVAKGNEESDVNMDAMMQIIQRHGEVQNEFSEMSAKELRSQCVQEALKEVIPRCISLGVDSITSEMRKESALKLSICEFENSKVDYPQSCKELDSDQEVDLCIFELKNSPQYWTTFSGNYREITKICYEESLPYEKDQIIGLYSNITGLYYRLYQELRNSHKASEEFEERLKNKADELIDALTLIIQQQRQEFSEKQEEMSNEYTSFTENVNIVVSDTSQILQDLSGDLDANIGQVMVHVSYLNEQLKEMITGFKDEDFAQQLSSMKSSILSEYSSLSNQTESWVMNIVSNFEITDAALYESTLKTQQLSNDLKDTEIAVEAVSNSLGFVFDNIDIQKHLLVSGISEIENFVNDTVFRLTSQLSQAEYQLETLNTGMEAFAVKMNNFTQFFFDTIDILMDNGVFNFIKGAGASLGNMWSYLSGSVGNGLKSLFQTISSSLLVILCLFILLTRAIQGKTSTELPVSYTRERKKNSQESNLQLIFKIVKFATIASTLILGATSGILCAKIVMKARSLL